MCVDIRFENLTCVVKQRKEKKSILNSVSGNFHPGKLTGILGSSGAGKTTLLNILAGYSTRGVAGEIYVDGTKKHAADLRHISTYLPQDILIQPFLTVEESLNIAAELKLGTNDEFKTNTINHVTKTLGLTECLFTRSEHLSGGQKKRLSIALELMSNPSVIFLDEPTTGLDEVSMKMCVELLKNIALEGKTVICTIHQPSDSTLKLFDHLYVMDDGFCIYNGSPPGLVPFLESVNLFCPTTYNPADYILEISQSNKQHIKLLSNHADRLQYSQYSKKQDELHNFNNSNGFYHEKPPFQKQVGVLLRRHFLQLGRNRSNIFLQCIHFTLCGLLLGGTFYNMGQDAKHFFHNFCFCKLVIVYLIFSNCIPSALAYPLEYKMFRNEIWNGWYGVNAYFTSLSLVSLPIPIIMAMVFTAITYFMSNQPNEFDRFLKVYLIIILTVIISESHGKAIAISCGVVYASVVAPATLIPLILLSYHGFGYATQLNSFSKIIKEVSFVRHSLVGVTSALYYNRDKVECSDVYCHYSDPKLFLIDMGLNGDYVIQLSVLVVFLVLYKCLVYTFLRVNMK